jgi:hypothetical protein
LVDRYLADDSQRVREKGIRLLKALSGDDMGFVPAANEVDRSEALSRWKEWATAYRVD